MGDRKTLHPAAPNLTLDEPVFRGCADQPVPVLHRRTAVPTWPLLILALPAAIAVWSGWVGIGEMTGFGEIRPLPGVWNSLHLDTAVTLPVGVEAYAAFALHAWLTSNWAVSDRTRRFDRWSAIAAMILGMSGQVAFHLLSQAGTSRAPWEVTTLVACLPVAVLGIGSALVHLLRSDADRHQALNDTGLDLNMLRSLIGPMSARPPGAVCAGSSPAGAPFIGADLRFLRSWPRPAGCCGQASRCCAPSLAASKCA